MKLFKKQKEQFISQVVILSMLFGFAAGVVGQIVADVYIDPWRDSYAVDILNTNADTSSVIPELRRVTRFLGIQQDFEVNKSIEKITPGLVGIYSKKSSSSNGLSQIYLPQDLKTNGFILTSDGWLVSFGEIFKNYKRDQLVVVYAGKTFTIDNLVIDATTNVVFLKISASNLPVVVLGDSDEVTLGQLAITLNNLGEAIVVNIKNTDYANITSGDNFVTSSEEYSKSILLSGVLDDTYLGSPLINLGGEVIGIIKEISQDEKSVTAVPINQFRPIILDVLRDSIVKRPFLGVSYIDLAWAFGLDENLTQGLNRGALVYQNPKSGTPAAEAGLQENDIISSVDGQQIDKSSSLTELIQQYQPGDEIDLEIVRAGKTIIKTVTLVILPD